MVEPRSTVLVGRPITRATAGVSGTASVDVLEEARAHDGVGLGQRLEHGRRAVRGVVLAGEKDGLDAEPLAGLDARGRPR